ncbi:MAG TPA: OmpA family protein, partial [Phenylobacterium sp.]
GPGSQAAINAAASAANAGGARLAITGYTDRTGDLAQNQALARNRAVAVRDALIAAGVSEANIEMRPPAMVETGSTNAPELDARRVEISRL